MTIQNDNLSSELVQILDRLTNDVNRKVLQILYDKGQTTLETIAEYLEVVSTHSLSMRLADLERSSLVILEHNSAHRKIISVKLTPFAQILLQCLFFTQIMLEERN